MNKIFLCDKMIRDKDPHLFEERGIKVTTRTLHRDEVVPYLKKKIKEEAEEVYAAETPEEALNEMVDICEAGMALCKALGVTHEEFWEIYKAKHQRKGGFEKEICLCSIEVPEHHPELSHYTSSPEKYPEKK